VSLMAGENSSILSPNVAPSAPQGGMDPLLAHNPDLQAVINDRYYHSGIFPTSTPIPPDVGTSTAVLTPTPTLFATWTPFLLGQATQTPLAELPYPTIRPTITLPAGFSGLTSEEQAAQGSHQYAVACKSWNNCVCDSAIAEPGVTLPIVFGQNSVTLEEGKTAYQYEKVWPNLYRVVLEQKVAEIIFLRDGFEFSVKAGGLPCSLQVFTYKP
jgi:hypothetical protein